MTNVSENKAFDSKGKLKLKKAFGSAKSLQETLKAFKEMESCFQESELGLECFIVAERISKQGNDFEQVLCFGKRALTILFHNYKRTKRGSYLLLADVLRLLGSVCLYLKRYNESLNYLNHADLNLSKLEGKERNSHAVNAEICIQIELMNVKAAMGKREEAVVHSKKVLVIKEKVMEEGSVGLGEANRDVSLAYLEAFHPEKALPFCLRALDIYTEKLGSDSVEVGELRRYLAVIYHKMGEHEKSFELNRLARVVLKKTTSGSPDLLTAETEGANTLINLGRYEEAVDVLKGVVSRDDIEETLRVRSFVTMARALCYSGYFADAEKYMKVARRMLEVIEMDPMFVAIGLADMSVLYQKMTDFKTSISLMKRALALPGLPQKLLPGLCEALMSLISKSCKEKEEVPYMEGEVEKLKVSFGPEHCVVGYGYSNMGVAYLVSGQMELGAKSLANAKNILDGTLGPHHLASLKTSHGLSVSYAILGRYRRALEVEEKVIEGLKGLEPSERQFMHEVTEHLSKLRERVRVSHSRTSSKSKRSSLPRFHNVGCHMMERDLSYRRRTKKMRLQYSS